MKLYTEEQVITFVIELLWKIKTNNNDTFYNRETIKESLISIQEKLNLTPIELPSDEEVVNKSKTIDKDGLSWENDFARDSFVAGAKWMKEQIFGKEDKTFKRKSQWTEVDNMTRRLK